ncbi:MAG: tRNA epoxyqueuosine(34) reductase QueG [Anaerolineaceae bacterium]
MASVSISDIQSEAEFAGFNLLGIRSPEKPIHFATYEAWLEQGLYAGMDWISKPYAKNLRANPAQLLPGSKSLLSLAIVYQPSISEASHPGYGRVASYAWNVDYHLTLPGKLKDLAKKIAFMVGKPARFRVFTDSSPLMERDLAAMSGLGWIGRNTCLISPYLGSFLILAEILMDIDLPTTKSFEFDRCGTCRACIDACPTACIRADRMVDSNRCISYLTIEHKGTIPIDLRAGVGDWVFGCDVCQIVCPWNHKSVKNSSSPILNRLLDPGSLNLMEELSLSEVEFKRRFHELPIMRTGWESHLRNVITCAGNSFLEDSIPAIGAVLTGSPSVMLRSHAAWALGRFRDPASRRILDSALKSETENIVQFEIQTAFE